MIWQLILSPAGPLLLFLLLLPLGVTWVHWEDRRERRKWEDL